MTFDYLPLTLMAKNRPPPADAYADFRFAQPLPKSLKYVSALLAAALFALAIASLAASAPAIADPVPADLAVAAKDYDAAQMKGDGTALNRLLADDYTLVNGTGEVEDKKNLVADYTDPAYRLDPYVVEQPVEKVWGGNAAVLGGIVNLTGTDHGKHFAAALRFADIWAKRNGAWQVIYTEVTHLPAGGSK